MNPDITPLTVQHGAFFNHKIYTYTITSLEVWDMLRLNQAIY